MGIHLDTDTNWRRVDGPPALGRDAVAIWRIPLEAGAEALTRGRDLLTQDELARADRFRVARAHDQFVLTRSALRRLLGAYLDLAPAAVRFAYGPQGKPALAPPQDARGLKFNVSHSGVWAVVAFTWERALGVDIERLRPNRDEEQLAERFFSIAERAALAATPAEERAAAFHVCWTCKEAYLKGRGDGLMFPLDAFDVTLPPARAGLLAVRGEPDEAAAWRFERFFVAEGYAAACAVRGEIAGFEYYEQ